MMARFKRGWRVPVLVLTIASRLAMVGLVGVQTIRGQQSPGRASALASRVSLDENKSADSRLRSLGEAMNHSVHAAAGDKSYHGSVGSYLPLNVLWRIRTGGGDRTITVDPTERDSYPLDGANFYLPMKEHLDLGTVPLYRLFNGYDHMVSLDPNEGAAQGYKVEGVLGYPFVSQKAGTSELIRTYNPSTRRTRP